MIGDIMTEEVKNTPTIIINDKEYEVDSLTEDQKHAIAQLKDISKKMDNLTFQAEQLKAAQQAFSASLISSLESQDEEEKVEE